MFFRKKNKESLSLDIRTSEGFEQSYHLYFDKMYTFCRGKINSAESAEEIVHDIFKSLWERRETLQINGPVEHYLMRAVKLKIIDHFREQELSKKHLDCALADFCDADNCTENHIAFNELKHRITMLVDSLPCQCREIYLLSREKGMSNKEIASTLLISEKTVENHMTKALGILRRNLEEYKFIPLFILSIIRLSVIYFQ